MAYNRQYQAGVGWQNEPSVATPINATNLNQMDDAIIAVDAEAARAIGVHDDSIYDLYDRLEDKQDTLVFDDHPILGSSKPVTSDGIFRAIQQGGGGGGGDNFLDEVYIIGLDNQPSLISPALEINTVSRIFDKDKPEYLMFRFGRMAQESGWSGGQTITLNVNNTGDFAVKKNHITQTTDTWSIKGEVLYIACINHSAGPSGTVYYWDFFEVPFDSAGNYEILPITHGGTGNALGYIRTGQTANTTAGTAATAEGADNTIRGNYSHAEGQLNSATGNYTHAGGYYNTAGYPYQTVIGRFNENKMTTLFEVGRGTGVTDRKNAFEVYSTGDVTIDGQLYVGSTIYDMNHNAIYAVEANPSGSATTPLSKLKVAGTIFSVGGGGAVDSVNGKTGVVVLDSEDVGTFSLTTQQRDQIKDMLNVEDSIINSGVYGVQWAGDTSSAFSRTDNAADFSAPVPQANLAGGSSPFDNIMPWCGMRIVNDANAGELVEIPKFYYKWTRNGSSMKLQISPQSFTGSFVSPAHADRGDGVGERDYVYVGRYHCSTASYKSTRDVLSKYNLTRADFRTAIHNLGVDVWQWDFAMYWTVAMLYLVEFADWDTQAKIGIGCGYATDPNGLTNAMTYHTGRIPASVTDRGANQYRHIENLWGGGLDFVDGIRASSHNVYCIKNPANFSDTTGGTNVGTKYSAGNGYIKSFTNPTASGFEYALVPSGVNSSPDTPAYIRDYYYALNNPVLSVGGDSTQLNDSRGLFLTIYWAANYSGAEQTSRLMVLPSNRIL